MPSYIFYPPPMPQSTIPPLVKFPISTPPPAPDNPPFISNVSQYLIRDTWQPGPLYRGNLQKSNFPIPPFIITGDNPPLRQENTINRINLLWNIPPVAYTAYAGQAPVAHLFLPVDSPSPALYMYPRSIYLQHLEALYWNVTKHRPIRDTFITPGTIPTPPSATFQVNVNIFSVRHSISIEVNNNLNLQNVNQGSTFIFTIRAFHRKGFPRVVSMADAVSLVLKDSLGNVVVSSGVTTKEENTFTYTYQLDTNAPKGPWSIQAIASFSTDIRITPFTVCFTVI